MFKFVLRLLMHFLFRVEVRGDQSVFGPPKTLIVANHESFLDGLLLGLFLPVRATFVVHAQVMKNRWFRLALANVPHLVVEPANPLAMKAVIRLLEKGENVVIFPEGRLTDTGSLMKVYDGAAFVAAKTGARIVPVRISGAAHSYFGRLSGLYPLHMLPKISLHVLAPTALPMPEGPNAKARRRRAGEAMRQLLQNMLVQTRPRRTLYQAFCDARDSFGRKFRLAEDINMVEETYGSLTTKIAALARLTERHTSPREHVGVLMPNAVGSVALVLGLSARGRVPAMLNYTAGRDGIIAACTAAQVKTILTSRSFIAKGKLDDLIADLPGIRVQHLEDLRGEITLLDKLGILFARTFPRAMGVVDQQPNDPAVILFTSGSEGKPKGVVHSHDSLLANVAQIRAVGDFTPLDKFMVALPLFHSFGLTAGALLPVLTGCKVFFYPNPLHYRLIPELIYDRNCTVMFGTSTFLANYAKYAHPYDFGRLRYVVAGAEKLGEETRRVWMEKFGIRILEGYGVTECAPVIAVNTPMACHSGTVGQLLPGIEHRLIPVPGLEQGGLLEVRGPNLMLGYLRYERPGVLEFPDGESGHGWYSTGDVIDFDEDRFVRIVGRVKRFAKIAGEMVSLEVSEKLALTASPDHSHATSSRPDASKGEAIVLFTTDRELKREQLAEAARQTGQTELAIPREIRVLEAIPLLGTGKTDYVTLKKLAETR
ncbi:bifunctional acyl-ACP--phospholipid O-acyltransferase/long-chain-fatty-acid--ACP ligase [Chitinilyticum piscinae]|uniref:Bifunctional acyl-ACP--phospholipid O-acyltransferase/long-chain-fatty-acid--ACP ligase n=1 Tax=Chitinilyticum piscinae TaxID=2866724 RepID=A0A8J7FPM3_9NEIS|nr:bifunctional acyl-ACP--phospholipid O-acyltransferase/long-chain-fatty-acid--ACP ligase [Chitinilyticum piscinae]MBE9609884.1 bifunctional acyl-ACP--phospholipid O-acyltransferase/long-chain-fatty-acid--ACP ligase [Chitinilyticum piscinae]